MAKSLVVPNGALLSSKNAWTWHKTGVDESDFDFSVEWACSAPESDTRTWAVMDDDHPAAA